jgi:hypothetical protein
LILRGTADVYLPRNGELTPSKVNGENKDTKISLLAEAKDVKLIKTFHQNSIFHLNDLHPPQNVVETQIVQVIEEEPASDSNKRKQLSRRNSSSSLDEKESDGSKTGRSTGRKRKANFSKFKRQGSSTPVTGKSVSKQKLPTLHIPDKEPEEKKEPGRNDSEVSSNAPKSARYKFMKILNLIRAKGTAYIQARLGNNNATEPGKQRRGAALSTNKVVQHPPSMADQQWDKILSRLFKNVRTMKAGAHFGEIALSSNMARSATLISGSEGVLQVATLHKEAYKEVCKSMEQGLKAKWRFFSELLEGMSKETIAKFGYPFKMRQFNYNYKIIEEGRKPDDIFVIKQGEVQVREI